MKVIIVLFSVFLLGCYENDTLSKACFILDEAKACLFRNNNRYCVSIGAFGYISVIGTKYEYLLDRVEPGTLVSFFEIEDPEYDEEETEEETEDKEEGIIKTLPYLSIVSKEDGENLIFNFFKKHNELIDKENHLHTLINFHQHYDCPNPEI